MLGEQGFEFAAEPPGWKAGGGGVGGGQSPFSRDLYVGPWNTNLKRPFRYPNYIRVGGGASPAAHHAEVHRVAHGAGVHPARLMALNPESTGVIRIA
jgi:hypothetical protein